MFLASTRSLTRFALMSAVLIGFAAGQRKQAPSPGAKLSPLLEKIGTDIDWQPDWRRAAVAATRSGRPILVAVYRYRGFKIPDQQRLHVFASSDVTALLRDRFVTLHHQEGMKLPFADYDDYGMGPMTLGAALLVVTADGRVTHQTHTVDRYAAYDFLVASLQQQPPTHFAETIVQAGPEIQAAVAARRGEHERALELLEEPTTALGHLIIADVHRRARRGAAALAAVAAARALADQEWLPRVELMELVLRLRLGELDAAQLCSARIAKLQDNTAADPTALYWSGIESLANGDNKRGENLLTQLVRTHREDRYGWHAAQALLQHRHPERFGLLRWVWPEPDVAASVRNVAGAATNVKRLVIERDAGKFLRSEQREDGSWISPSELTVVSRGHPFTVAITSLAARSLLQRRSHAANERAVRTALRFVLAHHEAAKNSPQRSSFMDYTVWSETMALRLLADCLAAEIGDAAVLRTVALEKIAALGRKQNGSGGFSYFLTTDLDAATAPPVAAMTFTTAAVLLSLLRAREVGLPVDELLVENALDVLDRARGPNGAFAYSVDHKPRKTAVPGAAGRGPVCELARLRGGRGTLGDVRRGLALFQKHRAEFRRELGKSLMHAGPDGQGCHYLFFDYATAAEAAAALPAVERAAHAEWLLEEMLRARSVEGGFRDTSINGWPFGTAMALTAMHELFAR